MVEQATSCQEVAMESKSQEDEQRETEEGGMSDFGFGDAFWFGTAKEKIFSWDISEGGKLSGCFLYLSDLADFHSSICLLSLLLVK